MASSLLPTYSGMEFKVENLNNGSSCRIKLTVDTYVEWQKNNYC